MVCVVYKCRLEIFLNILGDLLREVTLFLPETILLLLLTQLSLFYSKNLFFVNFYNSGIFYTIELISFIS